MTKGPLIGGPSLCWEQTFPTYATGTALWSAGASPLWGR